MCKEHLLDLSMDKNINAKFQELNSGIKAAFTRAYNATHKDPIARKTGTGGKRGITQKEESDEQVSDDDDNDLLNEEELADIKRGKNAERENAAKLEAAKIKVEEFTLIKTSLIDEDAGTGKKGSKKPKSAKTKKTSKNINRKSK